ncbi:amino acid racemase [Paracoccus suum]|uniref:Amino acid racemase n=1 Tax=Paracoccus suum TaxID=2259340 RepID=A0A344PMZ9_9RHOB|nr:amino acid racemase [Paracoccus suum]AXC50754.1 amino acid racemase [Paracoccus suum]
MKTIGMIGGLTWVSTAQYYRRLNEIANERLGGSASAKLVLASVNRADYTAAYLEKGDEDAAGDVVIEAARRVADGGADFLIICCNNAHRFVSRIEAEVGIPILHIAEASALEARRLGLDRLGLLGIRKTMESPFYADKLAEYGIETMIPNDADRTYINDKIYEELVKNVFLDNTRRGYIEVMERMQQSGSQGVVLGCTEIPLLVSATDTDIPVFDTTELHCQAAIKMAIGDDLQAEAR